MTENLSRKPANDSIANSDIAETVIAQLNALQYPDKMTGEEKIKARSSVDYLLRTTQQNLTQYSIMADQKANIILGISLLMFTVLLSLIQKSGIHAWSISLLFFTVAAAISALLSVNPTLKTKGPIKNPNLLFFGHYSSLTQQDYLERMHHVIKEDASVYDTIMKDIYEHGLVLRAKKYKYLTYSYRFFIAGIIVTVTLFLAEFMGLEGLLTITPPAP